MKNPHIRKFWSLVLGFLLAAFTPLATRAADIQLNANDALGQASFNSGAHWIGGAAPVAGNNYFTAGWFLRTPPTTTDHVFAGDSLTLEVPNAANIAGGNGSLLEKYSGASGAGRMITINNLTNAVGAIVRSGAANGSLITLAGNHWTIAGTSSIWADQNIWLVTSPLLGGDSVILTNRVSNTSPANYIRYSGNNSGFTGSWYITCLGANAACYVEVTAVNSIPANPSTFNPGQITLGPNGILLDSAGCTFNNVNGGFTLAGSGTINAASTTTVSEPITDNANGFTLTKSGTGTLILNNSNSFNGTIVSDGTLRVGNANAIPVRNLTVNSPGIFDLNGFNVSVDALSGSGTVDVGAGSVTLTVGANGGAGNLTGGLQNSGGTLSLVKVGAGTQSIGGYTFGGSMVAAGGTLNLSTATAVPPTPGSLIVSNGAVLNVNASSSTALPAQNLLVGANSTLGITAVPSATAIAATSVLTLQDNATTTINWGTINANPIAPVIVAGAGISAPGTNIVISFTGLGFKTGSFVLIDYSGAPLPNVANFVLVTPPGVIATLSNDVANTSIDINVTTVPANLAWYGGNGGIWDTSTVNWTNLAGGLKAFSQNDGVQFDDSLFNDFINPQPTNINVTGSFLVYPNPGVIVNATVPYSLYGAGGIVGTSPLVKSNTGSFTLLTSNSFSGGVFIYGGALVITNDSALGAPGNSVLLNSSTLQINGTTTNNRAINLLASTSADTFGVGAGANARFNGSISGAGGLTKIDNGILTLAGSNYYTGSTFVKAGTVVLDSGTYSTFGGSWSSIGQDGSDNATLTLKGTAAVRNAGDFNAGDIDQSTGVVNIQDSALLGINSLYVGSANNAGSTALGIINQSGGTVIQSNNAVGTFSLGGRTSAQGVGIYNLSGGTLTGTAGLRVGGNGTGTFNQSGGTFVANGGVNIARLAGSSGTYNLDGGLLRTFNIASSTSSNAVMNLNGGTIAPNTNAQTTTFFQGLSAARVRNGGAIIDTTNVNLTVAQALLHSTNIGDAVVDGGLTKKGSGTLTMTGVNSFTGPITNQAGILVLNAASTYAGGATISGGTLSMIASASISGNIIVSNNAVLSVRQVAGETTTLGNVSLSGGNGVPGATLGLGFSPANNPANALVHCGTLNLDGTNTIVLAGAKLGTFALVQYTGAIGGAGTLTNLSLPQGYAGFLSNNVPNSTLYAVITAVSSGIVWTGTNSPAALTNVWDIGTATNWLIASTGTKYLQPVPPGDEVTFSDVGSGTVILNTTVSPVAMTISNNAKNYTFRGTGLVAGPASLLKLGTGTATLNLTNNNFLGGTVVSNGTLALGNATALPVGNVVVGGTGTVNLNGFSSTFTELTGNGIVDNNSGVNVVLTLNGATGGTWNGNIQDHGAGGVSLVRGGQSTWLIGGNNTLNNGDAFNLRAQLNGGTTIITNGGSIKVGFMEMWIAEGFGSTSTVVVANSSLLAVSNNWLVVGRDDATANGTLIVNGGTVYKAGSQHIVVGSLGGTGKLIVNGGQVLNSPAAFNSGDLLLGENATGNGTLQLNGGLVQAASIRPIGAPANSLANFNGGIVQATKTTNDFLESVGMIQSGGLVLDSQGFNVSILSALTEDSGSTGGGLTKLGSGTLYLDGANGYFGTTVVSNGLLAGSGSISGPVMVRPGGALGAGDELNLGAMTINTQPITIQGSAFMRISKNGGVPANDLITGISTANYGGTLVISNATFDATPLATGDTFTLFGAGAFTGNFSSISGSAGPTNHFEFNPTTGVLSVAAGAGIAGYPTNMTFSAGGGSLTISWPATHLGWILQSQTNALSVGLKTVWTDITGTDSGTSYNATLSPTNPAVFYRLRHP